MPADLPPMPVRRCPACGYDLRGLPPGHLCPECGTQSDFYGPRRVARKQARRIDRRLVIPPVVVLVVLTLWGNGLDMRMLGPPIQWETRSPGFLGLVGATIFAGVLWPDLRRGLRVRRRLQRRGRSGTSLLGLYFWLQGVTLAAVVGVSLALVLNVVPPPGPGDRAFYYGVLLAVLLLEASAVAAAALGVAALLGRRRHAVARSAVAGLAYVALGTFTAGGCCVFPDAFQSLMARHPFLSFALLFAGTATFDLLARLRRDLGLAKPPKAKRPPRRRRRVLVMHPGEVGRD